MCGCNVTECVVLISTVLCQKALSAIFTFLQERQKTDYYQLLVTLMFGKITKFSAPNCPFTKLSCFLISVLKLCLILDNFFIFVAWTLSRAARRTSTVLANAASALRAFQHRLKTQSLDSSVILKGLKRLTPFSTGQFDQEAEF